MKIILPKFLKPLNFSELIRIGKNNDGGYVIAKKSLFETECLISLGLNDDCSFEEKFYLLKKCKVFCFDNTVHNKFWLKQIANDFFSLFFLDIKKFTKNNHIILFYKYLRFFSKKKNTHIKKNISRKGFFGSKVFESNSIDFMEAFNLINEKRVFLKIDIEGYEYRILDQILEIQNKLTGLAIEFHNCDLNLKKIQFFIEKFDLNLIHIHHNNWSSISDKGIPTALELTFAEKKITTISNDKIFYPSQYDQPNNPNLVDIKIEFNEN